MMENPTKKDKKGKLELTKDHEKMKMGG